MNKKRIGVLLSGSGAQDGSEIQEAVLTLLALDREGAEAICIAPDKDQVDVVDHSTEKKIQQKRNVLTESARIARGAIRNIKDLKPDDIEGLVIPGGFGAAKNLSDYATKGSKCRVDPDVAALLRALHKREKPIAAMCVAPTILASVFGDKLAPEITIGKDPKVIKDIETMGAKHQIAESTQVAVDPVNRFVTTPAYMTGLRIGEVAIGIDKAVSAMLAMSREPSPV